MKDPISLDEYRRLVDRHLSVVAHELRAPLSTLTHFFDLVEQLLDRGTLPPRHLVEKAGAQLKRFAKLIDDLADTTRISDGRGIKVHLQPIDLRPVVEKVVSMHRGTVDRLDHQRSGPAHTVVLEVLGDRFAVLGDPARLDQVVFNLIENALKFSPDGGEVRVVLDQHDGWHRLRVSDHGIGIPAGDLPRIGERFFRASNAAPAGTGMGFAIIQEIVHAHGGRLDIVSTFGEGTTVTVRLADDGE